MARLNRIFVVLLAVTGCGTGTTDPDPIGAKQQEVKVCANATPIEGIDVSHYDLSVDWVKVRAAGVEFAVAKATESTTYVDATFDTNRTNAKAAGVVFGAYHFFRADSDPDAQADHFVQTIGSVQAGEISPVLDLETADGQGGATIVANAVVWLQKVETLTGRTPIIYTSPSFVTSTLDSPPELAPYPLWIANWDTTCPTVPIPWTDWSMWQTSDSGTVDGIDTAVDLDRFDGVAGDLQCVGVTCPSGPCVAGACSGESGGTGGVSTGGASSGGAAGSVSSGGSGGNPSSGGGGATAGGSGGQINGTGGQKAKPNSSDDDSGCGCRVPSGERNAPWSALGLLAFAALVRRRR